MAQISAILSVLVDANTKAATAKLTEFDRQFELTRAKTRQALEAKLGGRLDPVAFDRYNAALDRTQRRVRDRAAFQAALGGNFSPAGFNAYQRQLDRSEHSTKQTASRMGSAFLGVGKAIAAAGAAYVGFSAAKSAIEFTTELTFAASKLSAQTGMDIQTASAWIESMKVRNVQSNALAMGMITLERNIRNAANGSKTATLAFTQLGVPVKDLKSQNLQATILQIADAFQKSANPTERAAEAQQLFGRNAKVLIPVLAAGAQGVRDMIGTAEKYGAVLPKNIKQFREAHEAQMKLNLAMDGLKISFTQAVLPYLIKGANALLAFIVQMREGKGVGGDFAAVMKVIFGAVKVAVTLALDAVKGWIMAAHAAVEVWQSVEHAFGQATNTILGFVTGFLGGVKAVLDVASHIPFIGDKFRGMAHGVQGAIDTLNHLREGARTWGDQVPATIHLAVTKANQQFQLLKNEASQGTLSAQLTVIEHMDQLRAGTAKKLQAMLNDTTQKMGKLKAGIASGSKGAIDTASHNFMLLVENIGSAMGAGSIAVKTGTKLIGDALNAALRTFGSKPLALPTVGAMQTTAQAFQIAAGIGGGFARGGMVRSPGYFAGEEAPRHPEVILATNPAYRRRNVDLWAQAGGMLGVPGFQGGGVNFYGHPTNVTPAISRLIGAMEHQFPALAVTATTDGSHVPGSYHYRGQAVDMAADAGTMFAAANWVKSSGMYHSLAEGIHNPNLAVKFGHIFSGAGPFGAVWAGHANHIHLAVAGALGAFATALVQQIKAPLVKGGGTVGRLAQAALAKIAVGANRYLTSHTPSSLGGSFGATGPLVGGGGPVKSQLFRALSALGFNKVAIAGIFGNIAQESSFNPTVNAGGLFQFTPPIPGSAGSVAQQVGLMWSHGGAGIRGLMNQSGDPSTAALNFMNAFERPAAWAANIPNRIAQANAAYAAGYRRGGVFPFVGAFGRGGVAPGTGMALVHQGEAIVPAYQAGGVFGGQSVEQILGMPGLPRIPRFVHPPATVQAVYDVGQWTIHLLNWVKGQQTHATSLEGDLSTVQSYFTRGGATPTGDQLNELVRRTQAIFEIYSQMVVWAERVLERIRWVTWAVDWRVAWLKRQKQTADVRHEISVLQAMKASQVGLQTDAGDLLTSSVTSRRSTWLSLVDLQDQLKTLTTTAAPPPVTADQSALIALLTQQLQETQMGYAVSQAQYKVLSGFAPPFGGTFAGGGVVPGPIGAPRTIIAHGGEMVSQNATADVRVVLEDHRTRVFVNDVEQAIATVTRGMARRAGRGLPGAGGGG
jgi:hypothetical protein